ncbi:hypothetical protein N0V93_010291 [Gnomoniopsis smithogilvyi]|uniref:Uncharacterized protein n=1 Tax=Gnomoniopsis smithogilvyi TaxID=1191159 RepID=A0A9W9CRS7_9PEZI|nr:hypothetical protein N0V93_010291 [Gnomoniopsis smithogilvyi]
MLAHATTKSIVSKLYPEDVLSSHNNAGHTGSFDTVTYHALKVYLATETIANALMRTRLLCIAQLQDVQDTAAAIPAFDNVHDPGFGSPATSGADLWFDNSGAVDIRAWFCHKGMSGKEGIANVLPRCGGTPGGAYWEVVVLLRTEHVERPVGELKRLKLVG